MIRHAIGIGFLSLQLITILYARFVPERFFCWAPYDNHSRYQISVTLDDVQLSPSEIRRRYRYRDHGWEPRSIANVFSIIQQYESTYGREDHNVAVVVTYQQNGKPERQWTWPQ